MEEDASVCPDARTLVARFNEQIEPIYVLLRETEDVNLSHDLLEPEPTEIPALIQRSVSESVCSIGPFISQSHRICRWIDNNGTIITGSDLVMDINHEKLFIFELIKIIFQQ